MFRLAYERWRQAVGLAPPPEQPVEPALVTSLPSAQNALDAFKGEWISKPPPPLAGLVAGTMPLAEDPRVAWGLDRLGGVSGQRVLELGPLEGAHTYMLQERGAREILAIEGNQRCFLKCLIMKELADLRVARFMLGNFIEYLRTTSERFDFCLASGVLYHMADPLELIHLIARAADRTYLWTHYYEEVHASASHSAPRLSGWHRLKHGDFSCRARRYEYLLGSQEAKFAGGLAPHAHWLTREDLLACLAHAGFTRVDVAFEEPEHPHGPCLALVASKG